MNGRKHKGIGDGTFHFVQVQARHFAFVQRVREPAMEIEPYLDERLLDSGNPVKKQSTTTSPSVADFRVELSYHLSDEKEKSSR